MDSLDVCIELYRPSHMLYTGVLWGENRPAFYLFTAITKSLSKIHIDVMHCRFVAKVCLHWNRKVVRMTALVVTGDGEGKLRRLQWRPGQSPWLPSRLCFFPSRFRIITPTKTKHNNTEHFSYEVHLYTQTSPWSLTSTKTVKRWCQPWMITLVMSSVEFYWNQ